MIGERIKEARLFNGWKIRELSSLTGMCENTLSRFEKSRRKPSFKQAVILAYHLGVSIYFLVTPKDKDLYDILIKLERLI